MKKLLRGFIFGSILGLAAITYAQISGGGGGIGGGGSAIPGGSTLQIQYNNAGAFGGLSNGTAGWIMTSNGAGVAPSFQAAPAAGIGGSIASGQVAVGSGVNTITGSAAFIYNATANLVSGADDQLFFFHSGPPESTLNPAIVTGSVPAEYLITADVTGWKNDFGTALGIEASTTNIDTLVNGTYMTLAAAGGYLQGYRIAQFQTADMTSTYASAVGGYAGAIVSQGYLNGAAHGNVIGFWYYAPDGVADVRTAFYSDDLSGMATNAYYGWDDSRGVRRRKEDNTFNSVGQSIEALYNPQFTKYTPGATDFERGVLGQWESNVFVITTEKGGTGTLRAMRIGDTGVDTAFGGVIQPTGYKSSDGSAGVTSGGFKNGLFTSAVAGYIGRLTSSGSTPSVANVGANSCGTSAATIAGNDNSGEITVGATAGTQCRVTFTAAAPNRWDCISTDGTTTIATRATYVDTTHVDFLGAFVAGDVVTYVCVPR